MKPSKYHVIIIIIIILFVVPVVGCVSGDPIVGNWSYSAFGRDFWLNFNSDNTFTGGFINAYPSGSWQNIGNNSYELTYHYPGNNRLYTGNVTYDKTTKSIYMHMTYGTNGEYILGLQIYQH
jgi:hypothetical protein